MATDPRSQPQRKIRTGDDATNRALAAAAEDAKNACPITGKGSWVRAVRIVTTDTTITHGLGRAMRGFLVTNLTAAVTIYQSTTAVDRPTLNAILRASAICTVDIWFF